MVLESLKRVRSSKVTGPDNIPAHVIKAVLNKRPQFCEYCFRFAGSGGCPKYMEAFRNKTNSQGSIPYGCTGCTGLDRLH